MRGQLERAVGRLDQELEGDRARLEVEVELELRQEVVDEVHVRGVVHLRHDQRVHVLARARDDLHDVAVAPAGRDAVDPHRRASARASPRRRARRRPACRARSVLSAGATASSRSRKTSSQSSERALSTMRAAAVPGTARQERRRRIGGIVEARPPAGLPTIRDVEEIRFLLARHGQATSGPDHRWTRDDPLDRARAAPGRAARPPPRRHAAAAGPDRREPGRPRAADGGRLRRGARPRGLGGRAADRVRLRRRLAVHPRGDARAPALRRRLASRRPRLRRRDRRRVLAARAPRPPRRSSPPAAGRSSSRTAARRPRSCAGRSASPARCRTRSTSTSRTRA